MVNKTPWRVFRVPEGSRSPRLDQFVAQCLPGVSRSKVQQLVAAGKVTVDAKKAQKGLLLPDGAEVAVWSEPAPAVWSPHPCPRTPLQVIYQDPQIIVLNKQAGIPSTPLTPEEQETLSGALVARFPDCAAVGRSPGDGGLLQRLDRETSGIVVAARTQHVHDCLIHAQKSGEMEKIYLAVVEKTGATLPAFVDRKLESTGPKNAIIRAKSERCHPLKRTKLRLIRDCGTTCLVEATIHLGQRHQIRAHLASAGFPIVGDPLYNQLEKLDNQQRMQLHAVEIRFVHPSQQVPVRFRADPPQHFLEIP